MPNLSPYRSLPTARRLQLVAYDIATNRESRAAFIQGMVARGGGFRAEKLRKWTPDQLAREVVRHGLETPRDELGLMHSLYVELEPALQIAFLEAAGVPHEGAAMPEDLAVPFATAEQVRRAAEALLAAHGEDARRYLRTIALYNAEGWPGLAEFIAG